MVKETRMELRVLRYFIVVAKEKNITAAAQSLHITQPTLSRQMMELETEFGKKLFVRGKRQLELTEEGEILRRRAEEILALSTKTKNEITSACQNISGHVYIGSAETKGLTPVAQAVRELRKRCPDICFHFISGNSEDLKAKLDDGLLDFAIVIEPTDIADYDFIKLPDIDRWGVLMRPDCPLAAKKCIKPADLENLSLIVSNQAMVENALAGWNGGHLQPLKFVATYNLLYNASIMVKEKVGCALCIDGIIKTGPGTDFEFRPLEPPLKAGLSLVWKKHRTFGKPAQAFWETLRKHLPND